ncbi:MAG: glycosyltransferase family 4 protein [Thermodesulfobacteriota bacterium]
MIILYDGYIYSGQEVGGINRYFENLIKRLPVDYQPILTTTNIRKNNFPHHENLKVYRYKRFGFKLGKFSYYFEKKYFRFLEGINNYDVIHPTYYSFLSRHNNYKKFKDKLVITVHDMIHEIFYPDDPIVKVKKKIIEYADRIICVSNNTRNDLLNYYKVDEKKVSVVYLGSDFGDRNDDRIDLVSIANPYFLFVGSRGGYKNFDLLLQAFSRAISKYHELKLVVVGNKFSDNELRTISELHLNNNIQLVNYINDANLHNLYKNSVAFVFPSKYEGFGLPAIEAMSSGAAVIASNSSSLKEIVGDSGILFDPKSSDDLTDILIHVYENKNCRDELIQKGFHRSKRFNWNSTLDQTLNIYKSLTMLLI